MFERFTEHSRRVVVLAQEEARSLKHDYIGSEHILLGLLRDEDELAAQVLGSLDVTLERARAQVLRIVGSGEQIPSGPIPFTPRAKKVLELAVPEAVSLGHNYIAAEHILLAIARENESVAGRILLDFDADPVTIRDSVVRMLPGSMSTTHPAPETSMSARHDELSLAADTPLVSEAVVDLGWRGRPIAQAALGAAVLTRRAFDRSQTGSLEPLQIQLLIRLALGPGDDAPSQSGELFESLVAALACDRDDLRDAVDALAGQQLLVCRPEQDDDEPIVITAAGATRVREWLLGAISLFGQWPPVQESADDAVG